MPPSLPKLFLASSSGERAMDLAKKLESRLKRIANVISWNGIGTFRAGGITLDTLITHSKNSDFAVVLFTDDDLVKRGSSELMVPRDNCVFELGLFMGALGLNRQRCFLLRDTETWLPTDLAGLTWIRLPKTSEEERFLDDAVDRIRLNIDELGYCYNHPTSKDLRIIPSDRLIDLETSTWKPLNSGDTIEVLVASTKPLEIDSISVAKKILKNMKRGVKYRYFCQSNKTCIERFSALIRTLGTAPLANNRAKVNAQLWPPLMAKNGPDVERNLQVIQDRLRVFFFPEKPAIQLCIHNARDAENAVCYFRHAETGTFIETLNGSEAYKIAEQLRTKCEVDWGDCVFQGAIGHELYGNGSSDFLSSLCNTTLGMFSSDDLKYTAKAVCFGTNIN